MRIRAIRRTYADLDPNGVNALVYDHTVFRCDRCHEGGDQDNQP